MALSGLGEDVQYVQQNCVIILFSYTETLSNPSFAGVNSSWANIRGILSQQQNKISQSAQEPAKAFECVPQQQKRTHVIQLVIHLTLGSMTSQALTFPPQQQRDNVDSVVLIPQIIWIICNLFDIFWDTSSVFMSWSEASVSLMRLV